MLVVCVYASQVISLALARDQTVITPLWSQGPQGRNSAGWQSNVRYWIGLILPVVYASIKCRSPGGTTHLISGLEMIVLWATYFSQNKWMEVSFCLGIQHFSLTVRRVSMTQVTLSWNSNRERFKYPFSRIQIRSGLADKCILKVTS